MLPLRLSALLIVCGVTSFGVAFVVAHAGRPAATRTPDAPRLPALPAAAAAPRVPALSAVAALPTIRVAHRRPTKPTTTQATTTTPAPSGVGTSTYAATATPTHRTSSTSRQPPAKAKTDPPQQNDGGVSDTGDSLGG